jgi:hypothetical protein
MGGGLTSSHSVTRQCHSIAQHDGHVHTNQGYTGACGGDGRVRNARVSIRHSMCCLWPAAASRAGWVLLVKQRRLVHSMAASAAYELRSRDSSESAFSAPYVGCEAESPYACS